MITGTLINVLSIFLGGIIGLIFNKGIPENIERIIFQSLGLFTLFLGLSMALESSGMYLLLVVSLVFGSVIGEILKLESKTENIGHLIKGKLNNSNPKFTEGLVTASMLFSIGSMAIIGPMNEVLKNDLTLLHTKSLLDGIASIILVSAFGRGVFFSIIPVFIIQAGVSVLAYFFGPVLSENLIQELSALGGLLILAIGLSLLDIKKVKIINMLPALVILILLYPFYKTIFG